MSGRALAAVAVIAALAAALVAAPGGDGARPGGDVRVSSRPTGGRGPEGSTRPSGRGPGGGYGRGGYRRRFVNLTKEQEAELLKHIEKHQPHILKYLADLRKKDERGYRYYLSWAWGAYQRLQGLPEELREKMIAKEAARRAIYRLLKAMSQAETDAEKKRLADELRAPVTVQFDVERAEREHRLTQLAKEIERVRAELKARLARRDEIITEQVEMLLKSSPHAGRHGGGPPGDRPGRGGDGPPKGSEADKAPPIGRGPGPGPRPGAGPGRGPGSRGPGRGSGSMPGGRRPEGTSGYGRGGPSRRSRHVRLTEEQEAELLKHLARHQPEIVKRFDDLRKKDERMYRYWLSRAWGSYQRFKVLPEDLRKRITAKGAARRKIHDLLRAIGQAKTEAEKQRLAGQLRSPVAIQFDAEQAEREYRLTRLAKEIERVQAELKARLTQHDKMIAERIERLIKIASYIGQRRSKPPADKSPKPPKAPK